jgi:hypothetical protein
MYYCISEERKESSYHHAWFCYCTNAVKDRVMLCENPKKTSSSLCSAKLRIHARKAQRLPNMGYLFCLLIEKCSAVDTHFLGLSPNFPTHDDLTQAEEDAAYLLEN